MTLYKLTDEKGQTYNNTQWGPGVTHTASGVGELCGSGWLHAYTSPLLAVLLNSIHAAFDNPRLWEADGEVGATDNGLKVGCTRLTTVREIPLPEITTEQRVRFGILCAKAVCTDAPWTRWAEKWLSGVDRGREPAWAAARAAAGAAWAAASIDLIALAKEAVQ